MIAEVRMVHFINLYKNNDAIAQRLDTKLPK